MHCRFEEHPASAKTVSHEGQYKAVRRNPFKSGRRICFPKKCATGRVASHSQLWCTGCCAQGATTPSRVIPRCPASAKRTGPDLGTTSKARGIKRRTSNALPYYAIIGKGRAPLSRCELPASPHAQAGSKSSSPSQLHPLSSHPHADLVHCKTFPRKDPCVPYACTQATVFSSQPPNSVTVSRQTFCTLHSTVLHTKRFCRKCAGTPPATSRARRTCTAHAHTTLATPHGQPSHVTHPHPY